MYQVLKQSSSHFLSIRGLQYHVRTWGTRKPYNAADLATIPLVMVHGWMDVSASFQFVVDALQTDRYIIAPDWRGYGLTIVPQTDNYWMPDYLADLDFLLDALEPHPETKSESDAELEATEKPAADPIHAQVDLIGHSMGGNIAMLYAGIRPERIRRLVNLEGFGMPRTKPENAGKRYAQWMEQLKKLHKGDLDLKPYDDAAGVAGRLMKTNKRISEDKALWLAEYWAAQTKSVKNEDTPEEEIVSQWEIQGDPAHKIINANLYQADEAIAIYKRITAPVLAIEAADNELDKWHGGKFTLAEYHERLGAVTNCQIAVVADAGHMMHHDQPEVLAGLIEEFLA
jgi:pimeloyl-ACP methyl ester carboxylesterase